MRLKKLYKKYRSWKHKTLKKKSLLEKNIEINISNEFRFTLLEY